METYANLGGDSNVVGYEIGPGCITVWFGYGAEYHYTNQSAGSSHIAEMQRLARAGRGLNGYIKRYVNQGYASKRR